jgi:hypothetical protein
VCHRPLFAAAYRVEAARRNASKKTKLVGTAAKCPRPWRASVYTMCRKGTFSAHLLRKQMIVRWGAAGRSANCPAHRTPPPKRLKGSCESLSGTVAEQTLRFLHKTRASNRNVRLMILHERVEFFWAEQRVLDGAISAIAVDHDHEALAVAPQSAPRPAPPSTSAASSGRTLFAFRLRRRVL